MDLTIDNQNRNLIPIQLFRQEWDLPDSFDTAYFEPKNWVGLGSIEGAGGPLAAIKQKVIGAIKPDLTVSDLVMIVEQLTLDFQQELEAANRQIGLRQVEVEFAISGFRDILQAAAYALIQSYYASAHGSPDRICAEFDFLAIYRRWLDDTVRVSTTGHLYEHNSTRLKVWMIYNAYGRIGLKVKVSGRDSPYYVMDMSLACPAASYMRELCSGVVQAICRGLELAS